MFKTSQSKMLEVVDKMLSDLKVKTEGTFRNTTCTISKKGKEIVTDEHADSDTVSSVSAKKIFDNDLPEIKRFVGNPKPMSFTKNWYSRPTPPDMQFEERIFQTQFSISVDKLYEWNIDGLSMVGIAYQNNHDLDQPEIVNLLVTVFFLELFVDGVTHISQKTPKNLLKMLLKKMMKVCLLDRKSVV